MKSINNSEAKQLLDEYRKTRRSITVPMTPDLFEKTEAKATELDIPKTQLIRRALRRELGLPA